jgi:hypothetical protein
MCRVVALTLLALNLSACARQAPMPAEAVPAAPASRLVFQGTMDLSRPGVTFEISHADLSCTGHHAVGRLPEKFSIPVRCNDTATGTMALTKSTSISGTVNLSSGIEGDVEFSRPVAAPAAAPTHGASLPVPPASSTRVARKQTGCGSRGGPGYRLPSGRCASWANARRKRR